MMTIKYIQISYLIIALALAATARAEVAEPAAVTGLRDRIELGYQAGDAADIEAARNALLADGSARSGYYAAHARFRQALLAGDDAGRAAGYLEECIGELSDYVATRPADAEARALLGSCYGMSTRYNKLGLARRGLEARRQIAEARDLAPANPWVVLQDGMADFSTPRIFGGDRDLAIHKLERATALFAAAAREGSRVAAWGEAEAWQQLAVMYRATGRTTDAQVASDRAAALLPAAPQRLASL